MAISLSACYVMQIYTNTTNYQNILGDIYTSGGPVVASSNLVIPTAENERLTLKSVGFFCEKSINLLNHFKLMALSLNKFAQRSWFFACYFLINS